MNKNNKHPSGLTWERWNWPFKTQEERVMLVKWFKKQQKQEEKDRINNAEPALF